ncbi:stage II sporulation protein M [Patulibacter sp. NPDC049589]|uniref:stage II sporulation protein M n=1 Tax=Patulibacter sp. NPDC049589 TaxID=3154731 RepID=UPI0034209E3E
MAHSEEMAAARLAARASAITDTRYALRAWFRRPSELLPWVGLSFVVASILLLGTYIVSITAIPSGDTGSLIAADPSARWSDVAFILGRNLTVLLLHLMVCFATYLVRRSLPIQADNLSGAQRWIHRHAATPALFLVIALTLYSIVQQALGLGHALADISARGDMSQAAILVRLLPHALPELIAVFLPLAAAVWLESRDRNRDLLAAVAACTLIAVPVVIASAFVEVVIASDFF